jgi:tetratricopeptide (TPR) repeat protein
MGLRIQILSVFAIGFLAAGASHAQAGGSLPPAPTPTSSFPDQQQFEQQQMALHVLTDVQAKEDADYAAFDGVDSELPDKKIQLGLDFLRTYPTTKLIEPVEVGLTNAYYAKQDWAHFYASADKVLTLNPNELPVLAMVGWVIPHTYNPNDPDAAKNLDKAERYEKHAIELSETLPKPLKMGDDEFLRLKSNALAEAHSGLGLVYFRRQQSEDSVKELQQATQTSANPDPADLFVLGMGLQRLHRNAEAAEAFNRCGQIPGSLQVRCKQSADASKKQAAPSN